jgi:hypothetical protein
MTKLMSHLSLNTDAVLTEVHKMFAPRRCDGAGWIVRLKESYSASLRPTLLIEAAAVRSGFSQDFMLRVDQRDQKITIRVEPLVVVDHNEGVHRAMMGVAAIITACATYATIDKYSMFPELRNETEQLIDSILNERKLPPFMQDATE